MKAAAALLACLLAAAFATSCTRASAQDIQVYRCGNTYSDSPCGAGQVVVPIRPSVIESTPGAWQSVTFGGPTLYVVPPWYGGGATWRTHDGLPWHGRGQAWRGGGGRAFGGSTRRQ